MEIYLWFSILWARARRGYREMKTLMLVMQSWCEEARFEVQLVSRFRYHLTFRRSLGLSVMLQICGVGRCERRWALSFLSRFWSSRSSGSQIFRKKGQCIWWEDCYQATLQNQHNTIQNSESSKTPKVSVTQNLSDTPSPLQLPSRSQSPIKWLIKTSSISTRN